MGKGQFLVATSFPTPELCPRGVLKTSITYKLQVVPKAPHYHPTEPPARPYSADKNKNKTNKNLHSVLDVQALKQELTTNLNSSN